MYGFELIKKEFLEDIKSEGFIYKHKSGAKLIFIENEDENKVFSVAFKTFPENNKGTAHITEHTVLCGSRKYPVKDPFNELDKGSIHTYLNAMTYIDKTVYPVASTNEKDFLNLMKVYLDAVYFPLIYKTKGAFLQEGWNCSEGTISGVVYNEMRGVFSEPERILDLKINEVLFEDTCYKFYSGGVPENIPELTYEEFLEFHKKNYHPSNSIIYLYGNIDIQNYLKIIDEDYLSFFEFKAIKTDLKKQTAFSEVKETEIIYKNNKNKNYFEAGFIIGDALDYKLSMCFDIISDVLLNTEASPLKKALMDANLGESVGGYFDDDMHQTVFYINADKSEERDLSKFKHVIYNSLNEIVKKGLDRELILSCINKLKFYFLEEDFGYKPKGLYYNLLILKSFIYGEGNFEALKLNKIFKELEEADYENLVEKYLLKNKSCAFGILKAEKNNEQKGIKNKINKKDEEILNEYKEKEDTTENLNKIPIISLNDIKKEPFKISFEEEKLSLSSVIYSPLKNEDIVYFNLGFNTLSVPSEDISFIGVLRYILGKINTKNYTYSELNNKINYYTGDFRISFENFNNNEKYIPAVMIKIKGLSENIEKMFGLLNEVVFNSIFDDEERIKKLISEYKANLENYYVSSGQNVALLRCFSYFSDKSKYSDKVKGIDFYEFLKKLNSMTFDELVFKIKKCFNLIFCKKNLFSVIVSDTTNYKKIYNELNKFYLSLNDSEAQNKNYVYVNGKKNEAFITDSNVYFNVMAADFNALGYEYSGYMKVLNKIIETDYIWKRIRVEGGAYGGGFSFFRNGIIQAYSYRDPNILKTFKAYEEIYKYIENLILTERELFKYIIGTVSILDNPIKNSEIADIVLNRKMLGLTYEDFCRERDEILSCTYKNIKSLAEIPMKCFGKNYKCTLGNEKSIHKNIEIFDKISTL